VSNFEITSGSYKSFSYLNVILIMIARHTCKATMMTIDKTLHVKFGVLFHFMSYMLMIPDIIKGGNC